MSKSDDLIDRQAATTIPVMPKEHRHYQTFNLDDAYEQGWYDLQECIENLPSVQPQTEWNNHTVACLLAELFGDACACNFNGIDEWLPEKCEVIDACPNPVGVACWEQFLKHRSRKEN